MPTIPNPNFIIVAKDTEHWAASGSDGLTFEKQVVYVDAFGAYEGDKLLYEFTIDEEQIDSWLTSFKEMRELGITIPAPLVHSFSPEDRRGEVVELIKRNDSKGRLSLFCKIKFDSAEYAKKNIKSDVSFYAPPVYTESRTGKTWNRPIIHIGLTSYPRVADLEQFTIAASNVPNKVKPKMFEELIKLLELDVPAETPDEEVVKMITEAVTAMQTEIDDLNKQLEDAGVAKASDNKDTAGAKDIAASVFEHVKKDKASLREEKIKMAVAANKLKPALATKLRSQFVTGISMGDDTAFDAAFSVIEMNEPFTSTGGKSKTGTQHKPAVSSLVAAAKKQSESAKR